MARSDHSNYQRAAGKDRHASGRRRAADRQTLRRGQYEALEPKTKSRAYRTSVRAV